MHTVAVVASNVSIVALVGNGPPCLLTPNASCRYDPAWRNGTLHDIVGAGVRRGPATLAVGPAQGLTSTRRLGLVGRLRVGEGTYNTPATKAAPPSPSVGASTRTHSTLLTLSSSLRVKGFT
jgi:hypothetical protein